MKIVVDANILFSLARKDSAASRIVERHELSLYAPSYSILELKNHRAELVGKSSHISFGQVKKRLDALVEFIDPGTIKAEITAMKGTIRDLNDTIYLALAKKTGTVIWSNDPHLKEQALVPVLTTAELLSILAGRRG